MTDSNTRARQRRRGPAPTRSREDLARAGMQLADCSGLEAVTIRSVAERLQLAPAALYRYVSSKDALIEVMVDLALKDMVFPSSTGDVTADLTTLVRAQVDVMRAHPWLIETLSTVRPGSTAVRVLEEGLCVLADQPASGTAKLELLAMLTGAASLFARATTTPPMGTMEALQAATRSHPHLAAAFAEPGQPTGDRDLLERTVTALVQGLLDQTTA